MTQFMLRRIRNCRRYYYYYLSQQAVGKWSKSEALLLGTRQHLNTFPTINSVNIASSSVAVSGVILDNNLTFLMFQQSANFHLRALRHTTYCTNWWHGGINCNCFNTLSIGLCQRCLLWYICLVFTSLLTLQASTHAFRTLLLTSLHTLFSPSLHH